jgi:hypothetical protein
MDTYIINYKKYTLDVVKTFKGGIALLVIARISSWAQRNEPLPKTQLASSDGLMWAEGNPEVGFIGGTYLGKGLVALFLDTDLEPKRDDSPGPHDPDYVSPWGPYGPGQQ